MLGSSQRVLYSPFFIATDGRVFLDWVEIGNVLPSPTGQDDYDFIYGTGESVTTVWEQGTVHAYYTYGHTKSCLCNAQ